MYWILNKIDMLIGACLGAAAAMAASQTQALIDQYLQRLGGHLDEAKLNLDRIQNGVRYQTMNPSVRQELETDASLRVNELQTAYDGISGAGIVEKPFAFFNHVDDAILSGVITDFVPAIPVGTSALAYSIFGIVIALIVYEILKLPLVVVLSQPRRRRFKKRGTVS